MPDTQPNPQPGPQPTPQPTDNPKLPDENPSPVLPTKVDKEKTMFRVDGRERFSG